MTTQYPLTTKCPHCGGELLTLTGVLVALDMQDPRSDALQALDVACNCEQSKLAQEQAKRELDALKRQETARLQAEALKARLHNSGLPEAWHDRGIAKWHHNSEPRLYAREQAIAFGAELVLPCKHPRSLFIAGDIGTGKTFLASCLSADLIRRKVQVRWCNVGDVLRTIRSSFDRKDVTEEDTIRHLHDDRARWKRKNRVKQLKRTIERLRRENFYMKIDLHIPVGVSYDEYHSRRVDFTEKKPEPYFD